MTEQGLNALHVAARHGQVEIMRMLLDHKVVVNLRDVNGNTALHHAAGAGRFETIIEQKLTGCHIVRFTIANKYSLNKTMSDTCNSSRHWAIVKLLT